MLNQLIDSHVNCLHARELNVHNNMKIENTRQFVNGIAVPVSSQSISILEKVPHGFSRHMGC